MAIRKSIKQPNGVTTEYHRIAMVKIDTNQLTTILVYSYIDEESRNLEREMGRTEGAVPQYFEPVYHNTESDNFMTIEKAYGWLKELPEFIDAEDC